MADEDIKSITIPLSDINSIQSDGTMLLRYRVISKDKNRKSHWSKVYNINPSISFSELNGYTPIIFDLQADNGIRYLNPPGYGSNYIKSSISRAQVGTDSFSYIWSILNNSSNLRLFDVYTQWQYYDSLITLYYWTDLKYIGNTTSNSFSIQKPNLYYNVPLQTPSYSAPNIIFTTSVEHGIIEGQQVFITGVTPNGYNGVFRAETGTSGTTIVIAKGSNPGQITVEGKVTPLFTRARAVVVESSFPKITNIESANNIGLSISDEYSNGVAKPFSVWNSPTGSITADSYAIPIQTTTQVAATGGSYVTIQTTGSHGFKIGQQVAISGVTPSGYNGATRTITNVTSNTLTFFYTTVPAAGITVAGTVTSRNYATITGLSSPFTESVSDTHPIEIIADGLINFSGGTYTGRIYAIGKSGTQISVFTSSSIDPGPQSVTNIKL